MNVNRQNDTEDDDSDDNLNEILQKTAEKLKNQGSRDGQSIYEEFSKCTMEDREEAQKINYQENSVFDGSSDLNHTGIQNISKLVENNHICPSH